MQTANSKQVSQQKKVSGKNGEDNQTRGLLTLVKDLNTEMWGMFYAEVLGGPTTLI